MNIAELRRLHSEILRLATRQSDLWAALLISALGTALLGGILLELLSSVWWLTLGGAASIFVGAFYMAWRSGELEPLNGSILAVVYFLLSAGFIFGMESAQKLPGPLPGLAIGDSTFFFVPPLLALASGVAGSVVGGLLVTGSGARAE